MSRWICVDDICIPSEEMIAKMAVAQAPTIDVVFCRECKNAHLTYDGECKYCECWKDDDDNYIELYLDGDFFCGFGEREGE